MERLSQEGDSHFHGKHPLTHEVCMSVSSRLYVRQGSDSRCLLRVRQETLSERKREPLPVTPHQKQSPQRPKGGGGPGVRPQAARAGPSFRGAGVEAPSPPTHRRTPRPGGGQAPCRMVAGDSLTVGAERTNTTPPPPTIAPKVQSQRIDYYGGIMGGCNLHRTQRGEIYKGKNALKILEAKLPSDLGAQNPIKGGGMIKGGYWGNIGSNPSLHLPPQIQSKGLLLTHLTTCRGGIDFEGHKGLCQLQRILKG